MLLPAGIGVAELQLRPYIIQSLNLRYVIFLMSLKLSCLLFCTDVQLLDLKFGKFGWCCSVQLTCTFENICNFLLIVPLLLSFIIV
jgi:hypothetical protein